MQELDIGLLSELPFAARVKPRLGDRATGKSSTSKERSEKVEEDFLVNSRRWTNDIRFRAERCSNKMNGRCTIGGGHLTTYSTFPTSLSPAAAAAPYSFHLDCSLLVPPLPLSALFSLSSKSGQLSLLFVSRRPFPWTRFTSVDARFCFSIVRFHSAFKKILVHLSFLGDLATLLDERSWKLAAQKIFNGIHITKIWWDIRRVLLKILF